MPLTGLYSLGIHLYGETGGGKTTAMYTGTAIWGEPRGLTGTKSDTPNSRMNLAEVMHNMLLNTDEMTNILADMPPTTHTNYPRYTEKPYGGCR
eukprot:TRINITY_DN6846_c0_g1_i1.p1 TRINITY_DN6846_c0_g1~~TRINITY_DN6846_c0_g1_i1.p1  ORF type:complete len:104 (-),score=9.84 TRINITY_DN6846_c0_g1_i1:206-487(-)